MLKSTNSLIGALILLAAFIILVLYVLQRGGLLAIQYMLSKNMSTGIPVSSTPVTGFSFPTAPGPVSIGTEAIVGNVGITVTGIMLPANRYVGNNAKYTALDQDEEYLRVDITVHCVSSQEKCHLTEFDFGVQTKSGKDYPAELSDSYDLKGLLEGGDIDPGKSMTGSLLFVIEQGEQGLTLIYPRMFAFGGSAKISLGR
jgi:hypothetical protein